MVRTRLVPAVLMLALAVPTALLAQERRQAGGAGGYNAAAETTVKMVVVNTYTMPVGDNLLILAATVEGRPLQVILAPEEYVKKQAFTFTAGATVEVTGMPGAQVNGEPAMLARQVKSGRATLTLRDATGKPAWGTVRR